MEGAKPGILRLQVSLLVQVLGLSTSLAAHLHTLFTVPRDKSPLLHTSQWRCYDHEILPSRTRAIRASASRLTLLVQLAN